VPLIVEFAILEISSVIPNLLTTGEVPAPTLLGIVWGALYFYLVGILPIVGIFYIADLGIKLVASFVFGVVLLYLLIFGRLLGSLLSSSLSGVWMQIPVIVIITTVILLRIGAGRRNETKITTLARN
jgi:hypothetical protein